MRPIALTEDVTFPHPNTPIARFAPYCLAIAIAGLSGLLYWVVAALIRPNGALPVTILYRFGDTDYLSLFYALSRFQFHEFTAYGFEPQRLIGFPTGLSFLYALPIAIFGDAGFAVADVVISVLRMGACLLAARVFFRSPGAIAAAAISLFVLTGPLPVLSRYWTLFYRPLWDMRYLRPFVTGLFALILVINSHYFSNALHRRLPDWRLSISQGVLIGLTVQGDLHLGIIACFVTATLYLYAIIQAPSSWRSLLSSAVVVAIALASMLPFVFLQFIGTNPDVSRRLGWMTFSRISPPLMWDEVPWQGILILAALFALISWGKVGREKLRDGRRIVGLSLLFAMISVVSLPLSVIILGRGIQIFHFPFRAYGFVILGFIFVGLIGASVLFDWTAKLYSRRSAATIVGVAAGLLAAVNLSFFGLRAASEIKQISQQRPLQDEGWAAIPGYHDDLEALWRELSRPRYRSAQVLATFDHQLGSLWLTRLSHWLWLPDPFLATVPDSAIENRVVSFSQLIGMSEQEFDHHLGEVYFVAYILSSFEWPDQRLPPGERLRLESLYRSPHPVDGKLDLVVLVRAPGYGISPGPSADFEKTYENSTFTVWARPEEINESENSSSTPRKASP